MREVVHRWLREDGWQLSLTDRGALRVRGGPCYDWSALRCPCPYEDAVVYALAHGYRWVRELPGGDAYRPDSRCKVRVARRLRGGRLEAERVFPAYEYRFATIAPWLCDLRRQPLAVRALREFRVRLHALRVRLYVLALGEAALDDA